MNFQRILGDRVLVSALPAREQSEGGIILPQGQAGDVMHYWRVEAKGPGGGPKDGQKLSQDVNVGNIIITPLYTEHTTLEDGSNRKMVFYDDIIGKFEEEAAEPFAPQIVP